jgi:hypothetical protein
LIPATPENLLRLDACRQTKLRCKYNYLLGE